MNAEFLSRSDAKVWPAIDPPFHDCGICKKVRFTHYVNLLLRPQSTSAAVFLHTVFQECRTDRKPTYVRFSAFCLSLIRTLMWLHVELCTCGPSVDSNVTT